MKGRDLPTSRIIACIPFSIVGDLVANLKGDYSTAEGDGEPTTPARETANSFSKLELRDGFPPSIVPENDLVWRVKRTSSASEKEE